MFAVDVLLPPGLEYTNYKRNNADNFSENQQTHNMVPMNAVNGKTGKKVRLPKRKKKKKQRNSAQVKKDETMKKEDTVNKVDDPSNEPEPEIEYVCEEIEAVRLEPMYRQYAKVFEAFRLLEPNKTNTDKGETISQYPPVTAATAAASAIANKFGTLIDEYEEDIQAQQQAVPKNGVPIVSKRKMKQLNRLSVAELKQLVDKPDVVELHDVTARDPKLLVQLKASRNTVPVPRHWCFKRKYLQGKRGFEKPPFELPASIKSTGITDIRASLQEKEDNKTLKAKMREKARPKMGKINIDYQKLHDAFFKHPFRPDMTIHGDLYYEGKELETRLKERKPGEFRDELRTALGMPVGHSSNKVPPPWLIAMQRYGPPPSYPNLKIAGLNAPIPEGCAFGYHAGGWGKPPVDANGKPLYGDVFGTARTTEEDNLDEEVDKGIWGEMESDSSEEEDDEDDVEEEDDDEKGKEDATGLVTPGAEGLITPSGITSMPAGMATPETIELRKRKIESEMEDSDTPALFTILQERKSEGLGSSMMGSTHVYDMTGAGGQAPPSVIAAARRAAASTSEVKTKEREGAIELALDPSELDLDSHAMATRYEETMRDRQALQHQDCSDMVHDHVHKQKNKRKRPNTQDTSKEPKSSKKYKEFKF